MKLFFFADDSLYKIFKTLEKIPRWKEVEISIEPTHSLFDNEWRWKQIKDIIDKRAIKATFPTQSEKCKKFFDKIWLKPDYIETNKLIKTLRTIYLFFFNIRKFHLDTKWKKYWVFFVFWFEILFILWIIYLVYSLVIPNAKITINPSQTAETIIYNFRYYPAWYNEYDEIRHITIPYYTGSFEYKYDLSINTVNVKYLQNPSIWEIKIFNTTNEKFTFVPNTRFITEDGRLFKTTNYVDLPAGYDWIPWEKIIRVKAMEQDDNWIFMWARWNIPQWTKLYIKNLKQSYFLQEIYAVAMQDFTWWSLDSEWEITQQDIDLLSWKLVNYIDQQKKNIAIQNFSNKDGVLLTFSDTIRYDIKSIDIPHEIWEKTSLINWTITVEVNFIYITRNDLVNAFSKYIQQRPSEKSKFISLDKNSLVFYEDDGSSDSKWVFVVPTKIQVIQWYDFSKDINWLLDEIKDHIVWDDIEDARAYILQYPEISSVKLKISPRWYSIIPKLKSRIKIVVNSM